MLSRARLELKRAFGRFRNVHAARLAQTLWRAITIDGSTAILRRQERPERVVVTLTTTPSRASKIGGVLKSLIDQSVQPDRIMLALPTLTRAGVPYPDRSELQLPDGVTVLDCDDVGPATKLLPALIAEPGAVLVVVDDDVIYPKRFIETLLAAHRAYPMAALGMRGAMLRPEVRFAALDHVFATGVGEVTRVDVLFGTWGYLIPPGALGPSVHDYSSAPPEVGWVDDIWFSGHLARRGVKRLVVPADELPLETANVWRQSLTGGVNASGRNDEIALAYFSEDW